MPITRPLVPDSRLVTSCQIREGDSRVRLRNFEDDSVDAVVTDPPYGLSFMGRDWDKALPDPEVWTQCLRVMKPGAHLVAFGAPRLYHRLACQIEDAGFEVRDSLMWLFGTGFPKSHSVSKAIGGEAGEQWKGWGTALKPAYEPIILARKPLCGTVAKNVTQWGTGAINVDACRIGQRKRVPGSPKKANASSHTVILPGCVDGSGYDPNVGRWPANVVMDEEVCAMLDEQAGERASTLTGRADPGQSHARVSNAPNRGLFARSGPSQGALYADTGGASRFFYCPKASKAEREAGIAHLPERTSSRRNHHPTVKPIALMRWLVRLVTPPGGFIVDPFAGSGSSIVAATLEGFDAVGIERDPDYAEIARARVAHAEATRESSRPAQAELSL